MSHVVHLVVPRDSSSTYPPISFDQLCDAVQFIAARGMNDVLKTIATMHFDNVEDATRWYDRKQRDDILSRMTPDQRRLFHCN